MGRCSKWNLLPNGSVGIAIWQRLFLHRFPASEGLPGFLSWRAIARRIWSQLSAMVCRSRPWKPSPANWIFPPRKSGCSAGSLCRRFRGKERSAQSTPPRHGQGAHRQQRGLSLRVEPSSTRQARPRGTPASLSSDDALLETLARVGVQPPSWARPRRVLGCEGVHPTHQH